MMKQCFYIWIKRLQMIEVERSECKIITTIVVYALLIQQHNLIKE